MFVDNDAVMFATECLLRSVALPQQKTRRTMQGSQVQPTNQPANQMKMIKFKCELYPLCSKGNPQSTQQHYFLPKFPNPN
jgi:hypothetical protein